MAKYKLLNGERVLCTAEEEAEIIAREEEYAAQSAQRKLSEIRKMRDQRLKETDYMANSDYTMPDNIKTWRQSLRDIPQDYTTEAEYDTLLETSGEFPNIVLKHEIWSKP
jgi:hypothetical protein|tara:strand:+ start:208 stop:537 length:330 start_codon:yes stop_codon:yes gene_type:complete